MKKFNSVPISKLVVFSGRKSGLFCAFGTEAEPLLPKFGFTPYVKPVCYGPVSLPTCAQPKRNLPKLKPSMSATSLNT